jgi:hypothetical protein
MRVDAQTEQAYIGGEGCHDAGIEPATIRNQGNIEADVAGDWQHIEYTLCIEQRFASREV